MANRTAVIQTNKGTIRVELLESDAPKATENFITLAERGYYDGIIFHRCIKNFMSRCHQWIRTSILKAAT